MSEKSKGMIKEAAGALTGDEGKQAEGKAQRKKGAAREERDKQKAAARKEREQQKRTRTEQNKAVRAEKSRDNQESKDKQKDKGSL
jgi:uncharacterized protein YjbJ (UPF0337 family)